MTSSYEGWMEFMMKQIKENVFQLNISSEIVLSFTMMKRLLLYRQWLVYTFQVGHSLAYLVEFQT